MEAKEEKKHPLVDWQPVIEGNWENWVLSFESEDSVAKRIGMLYTAFETPADSDERIRYLLALAEGYDDDIRGTGDPDYRNDYEWNTPYGRMRVARVRAVVARKAFDILCTRFFKNDKSEGDEPAWAGIVRDIQTLEAVFHFFRLEKPVGSYRFVNLSYHKVSRNEHHVAIAAKFLQQLVEYAWPNWRSIYDWGEEFDRFAVFRPFYPQLIEILYGLGRLGLLLEGKRFEWLSSRCLAVLEKLAFLDRKCDTLEEAMLGGSPAARVILNVGILRREKKRQRDIRIAEQRVKQAQQQLQNLKS